METKIVPSFEFEFCVHFTDRDITLTWETVATHPEQYDITKSRTVRRVLCR